MQIPKKNTCITIPIPIQQTGNYYLYYGILRYFVLFFYGRICVIYINIYHVSRNLFCW